MTRYVVFIEVLLFSVWVSLSVGDLRDGFQWPIALIHLGTGVVLVLASVRSHLAVYNARQAQLNYIRMMDDLTRELSVRGVDIHQLRQHMLN